MKPDIYLVKNLDKGSLNVMAKPLSGHWIEDEFKGIKQLGINRIVSLLESSEAYELGLKDEPNLTEQNNMEFIHFPIVDRNVPSHQPSFIALVNRLFTDITNGVNTVIHCRGGIGRTGMTACAILMLDGLSVDDAFTLISDKRGINCPDTEAQWDYMASLEMELKC